MRNYIIVMLFLGAGLLVSCGGGDEAVNKKISAVRVAAIRKGLTREQVRLLMGEPQSRKTQAPVRQPPGQPPLPAKYTAAEIWAFWSRGGKESSYHLPFTESPANKPPCTVIIYFDERGAVLDCETSGELPN